MKHTAPHLYDRYYLQKDDERVGLFELLAATYRPKRGLYPGSFIHITPSFCIENMVYVDSDRRMATFFSDPAVERYIAARKHFEGPPKVSCLQTDFTQPLPLAEGSFDVLISLYAGFVSRHCKRYLRSGGTLVANNSHGDASIAFTDPDYQLIGAVKRRGTVFRLVSAELDTYFQKKNGTPLDTASVLRTMRGEAFTRTAYAYVFRKISQTGQPASPGAA